MNTNDMTTKHEYEVTLIDDGTLDTVVSVEGTEYRYTWDPSVDEETTYDDFVAWAMEDAVQMYEIDLETLAEFYREERDNVSPRRALNWVRYTLKEAIKGNADEVMLKQALEIVEDLREKEVSA